MGVQKEAVMALVEDHRQQGRGVGEVLARLGIARATYYRWKRRAPRPPVPNRQTYPLTPEECGRINAVKTAHPEYRHRRIQGVLQGRGTYLSASAIYGQLKRRGQVEPYARRPAPWEVPRYEVWQKHLLWGCDWTRLSIAHLRWYLLTVMDFFSRYVVAWELVPSVNAGHVKAVYRAALAAEGIPTSAERNPELRVDRGSPNTARVTREFFESLGAERSFARVHRPTDNAITERFYGTVKQEEIYLVGNYPDEGSAREEIGRYIAHYHTERPHQALFNFTPAYVHQVHNKTALVNELTAMKKTTRERRKDYWINQEKSDSLNALILSH
jgi:putative transposase